MCVSLCRWWHNLKSWGQQLRKRVMIYWKSWRLLLGDLLKLGIVDNVMTYSHIPITDAHLNKHTHSLSSPFLVLSHSIFLSLTLSLSHTHTHLLSLSYTHTHTLSLSLLHTHTHTLSLSLSLSLSHTHTHTQHHHDQVQTIQ